MCYEGVSQDYPLFKTLDTQCAESVPHSRTEAKRRFTLDDHAKATAGVKCRKAADVIDETLIEYKSIDAVMESQRDLVDVVHTLRQVVCVKG
jgi:tRNA-splicing ligase RtcB